jgi:glycine C-acetyltransferase
MAATKNVTKFSHLDQNAMEKMLKQTRQKDQQNAIMVVTEGLFSMDADSPDLVAYQKICKKYDAYLLVDSAHDLGHIGQNGKGVWEVQGLTDRSNVIMMGTGSKCFGTNLGFVAC